MALFRKLVFARITGLFGTRLRYLISGGAPLPREIFEFFSAAEVPIVEGYGLTEASPVVAVNLHGRTRPGTVGQPLNGVRGEAGRRRGIVDPRRQRDERLLQAGTGHPPGDQRGRLAAIPEISRQSTPKDSSPFAIAKRRSSCSQEARTSLRPRWKPSSRAIRWSPRRACWATGASTYRRVDRARFRKARGNVKPEGIDTSSQQALVEEAQGQGAVPKAIAPAQSQPGRLRSDHRIPADRRLPFHRSATRLLRP